MTPHTAPTPEILGITNSFTLYFRNRIKRHKTSQQSSPSHDDAPYVNQHSLQRSCKKRIQQQARFPPFFALHRNQIHIFHVKRNSYVWRRSLLVFFSPSLSFSCWGSEVHNIIIILSSKPIVSKGWASNIVAEVEFYFIN